MTWKDRYWEKVDSGDNDPDKCWPWTGAVDRDGYGVAWVDGKTYRAPRVSLALSKGLHPSKLEGQALHHCDNPPCCNFTHLYEGDPKLNAEDRKYRGRWAGGRKKKGGDYANWKP